MGFYTVTPFTNFPNPSDTIDEEKRVLDLHPKLREWLKKHKAVVRFVAGTFEGRATTEFLTEEIIQRRKKIAHFVYHCLLAALISVPLSHIVRENTLWTSLRPGEIAEEDIVSPITAHIEPKETTKSYRENLAKRIPPIFDYDDQATDRWLKKWKKAFRAVRAEFYDGKKKMSGTIEGVERMLYEITEQKLGRQDLFFLDSNRFSPEMEKAFLKMGEFLVGRIIAPTELFDTYYGTGIMVRQINQSLHETLIQDVSHIWSMETAKEYLYQISNKVRDEEIKYPRVVARLVASVVQANLQPNETLTKKRIALVLSNLKEPIQSVQKGKVIIAKGERLSENQAELLQNLLRLTSARSFAERYLYTFFILLIFFSVLFRINMTGRGFWNLPLKDAFFFLFITLITLSCTKYGFPFLAQFYKMLSISGGAEFLIPVGTGAIFIHLMMGKDAGYTYAIVYSILTGYMLDQNFSFMMWSFLVNAAVIQSLRSCKLRTDIFKAGAWSGLVGAGLVFSLNLVETMGYKQFDLSLMVVEPCLAFFSGLLSAVISSALVPFAESAFGYTTSLKLLELSNFNHPLLHTLMMKAPGTYHHSVIVGSLAELAADKVNGNGLLARVSAYYHDIGKMNKPLYFIENQSPNENPHDHLQPSMSAKILFSHVKVGVKMGRDYHLGKKIIDIIEQHHGTTLVSYFYNKAKTCEDKETHSVEESHFRYPGPKPRTREAGIVMLADACEAATRSIADPTPSKIQAMVHHIITKRFLEEQFSDCDLTLRDLQVIEEVFTRTLVSLHHHRIEYPGQKNTIANAIANANEKKTG